MAWTNTATLFASPAAGGHRCSARRTPSEVVARADPGIQIEIDGIFVPTSVVVVEDEVEDERHLHEDVERNAAPQEVEDDPDRPPGADVNMIVEVTIPIVGDQ